MKNHILIFAILGIFFFSSCEKENINITTVVEGEIGTEEEFETEIIECSLMVNININFDNTFTAIATDGVEPISYLWMTKETTQTINSNISNAYSVTITDAVGCTAINETRIVGPCDSLKFRGGNIFDDERLCLEIEEGAEPFTYIWNTGDITPCVVPLENGIISGTITDANGCGFALFLTADVKNECEDFEVSIDEELPGELTLNTTNGAEPFSYIWTTGETTKTISVLNNGIYSAIVTDGLGCRRRDKITVALPGSCHDFTACFTETNEVPSLGVEIKGGTAPYSYQWDSGMTGPSVLVEESRHFSITITDATGCIFTMNTLAIKVNECNDFYAEVEETSPGTLSAIPEGGIEPYAYHWSTGEISKDILVTESGVYRVEVQDAQGCRQFASISFGDISELGCDYSDLTVEVEETTPGVLNAIGEGGVVPYSYLWSTGETTSSISVNDTGTFTVEIEDANGCTNFGIIML